MIHAVTNSGDSAVEITTAVEMNSASILYSAAKMVIKTPTGKVARAANREKFLNDID